jgi:hypothetical protein
VELSHADKEKIMNAVYNIRIYNYGQDRNLYVRERGLIVLALVVSGFLTVSTLFGGDLARGLVELITNLSPFVFIGLVVYSVK